MFARSADELTRLHGIEKKPGGAGTSGSCQRVLGGRRPPNVFPTPPRAVWRTQRSPPDKGEKMKLKVKHFSELK